MKDNWKLAYMDVAERFAQESYATRLHVGAIVVKDNRIISIGINGMPSGWENVCEGDDGKSKPEVLHAETNAIAKLAKSSESGECAAIFITHSPCLNCAKMIYQAGISEVYYRNEYRCTDGIEFLKKCEIIVEKI
jgi:dCMP deaminase